MNLRNSKDAQYKLLLWLDLYYKLWLISTEAGKSIKFAGCTNYEMPQGLKLL